LDSSGFRNRSNRGRFVCPPSPHQCNQTDHHQPGNNNRDPAIIPPNATLKYRINPEAEFIKRQADSTTIEQRNPTPRPRTMEHQREITGDRQNENSINVMVYMNTTDIEMHAWRNVTEETGAADGY
jgi:hypothetical protein